MSRGFRAEVETEAEAEDVAEDYWKGRRLDEVGWMWAVFWKLGRKLMPLSTL